MAAYVAKTPLSAYPLRQHNPLSKETLDHPQLFRRFNRRAARGAIYHGEALAYLASLRVGSADLIFLDPPFNLGKRYGSDQPNLDRKPDLAYRDWMYDILNESMRVLAPGGALYLYHVPQWAIRFGAHLDSVLDFRHWISVTMKNGFVRGDRLYPAHYALLYYTKGKPTIFRRPKLRPVTCRHCGKLVKSYGGYTKIIEEKGINLSDCWDDISPVRHKKTKHRAANELPLTVFQRVVEMSGAPGMIYLDPFAGSGSGVLAAAMKGMKFRSCDIVASNCALLASRLERLSHTPHR